ncbi:hypothetical protein Zmor_019376 [Zophobas morio]|uniref:Ionotropic receptor n=1 Tax=Zophobas morio TaxID=2755281 RepID=A0AA38I487_9CUCU|nr:hypothetical protein Zmor_019376 [Zophobas morio]
MRNNLFLGTILHILTISLSLKFTDKSEQCSHYYNDFWIIYENHFFLVNKFTIHVVQNEKNQAEVNQYTNIFLKRINSHFDAFKIEESFLGDLKNHKRRFCKNCIIPGTTLDPIDQQELARIKLLSSDSSNGYYIVSWDVETLHDFLDHNSSTIILEERATYALQFVFHSSEYCSTIEYQIGAILQRFWVDYNVVNVIAHTPCSCHSSRIYIYRPFVKINESWGITQYYSFDEITSNFRTITNILDNFNQFPLNITIIPNLLGAVINLPNLLKHNPIYQNLSSSKGFGGVDGLILATLADRFNFDVNLVNTTTDKYFSDFLPQGTPSSGGLNDALEPKVAYSANSKFLLRYDLNVDFVVVHAVDHLCVVVPKAQKIPKWTGLFRCFTQNAWFLIASTCIVCTVVWYLIAPTTSLSDCFWTMFSYLFGSPVKVVPRNNQLFVLASCLYFNIVVLGIIQGYLFRTITTTEFGLDMDTLDDVDKSGLTIETSLWLPVDGNSSTIANLRKKLKWTGFHVYDSVATHRNIAATNLQFYADFLIRSKYIDEEGLPLLHIVDECLITSFVGHFMPKGSALFTIFNNAIMKMVESGLAHKWLRDISDSKITENIIKLNKNKEVIRAFSLYDLQIAFYLVVFGCIISVFIFLSEVLWHKKYTLRIKTQ